MYFNTVYNVKYSQIQLVQQINNKGLLDIKYK